VEEEDCGEATIGKNLMFGLGRSAVFITPNDVELCKAKLESVFAPGWAIFSKNGFLGHASNWRVSVRKNIKYRNSFQTVFVGTLKRTEAGTRLKGRFRLNLFIIGFTVFWFGGVSLAGIAFIGAAVTGQVSAWAVIVPAGLLLLGFDSVSGGRHLARNEAAEISAFIEQLLDAQQTG
jgi:hypothetical protein